MMTRSVVLAVLLAAASVALAQDIGVVNGAFEGDEDGDGVADGWEFVPRDDGALEAELSLVPGREGGTAQKIDCSRFEDGHVMLAQHGTVAIEGGEWYEATVWLRAEGVQGVSVGIHDTDGWQNCGLWRSTHPPDGWRRYSWRFQGDHDCHETSRLQIWFTSTGTLWIDDLTIQRIDPPPRANTIPDIGSTNLVPNSSFECGPDRWISAGHWRLFGEVVEEDAVHGNRCMKVEWSHATAPVFSFDYYDMRRTVYSRPAITSEGWLRLEEGADYVFSAWLRADREVPCVLLARGPSGRHREVTVTLGTDWERFELPFSAREDLCYVQMDARCDEVDLDELTYWVDAVQVERGEAPTDYEPRRPIEIGAQPVNETGIFIDEEPAIRVEAFNDGPETVEIPLAMTVADGFDREEALPQHTLRIPAGGSVSVRQDLPQRHRFCRISLSGEQFDDRSVRLASLPNLGDLGDSPFGINHAYGWNPYVELARDIGVTWARDWSLKWDHVEPEPGRWDFEMADYQIERPLGLGMNVLCMFPFPSADWSSTAPPLEEIPQALRERAPYRIRTAYAPRDLSELERYAEECVRRFSDRIDVWEVFNESIFTSYSLPKQAGYEALDYIPLLEAIYRGCKRADPDCRVMGGYSTPPGNFENLHRPFIEAGGLQFCDIYSLHVYPGGEPEFMAQQLQRITDLMREHGGVKPMWMTEFAYYADDDPDPIPRGWPNPVESELRQADWNTRICAIQLAHGVERIFYHIWHTRANRDSAARIFFEYGGAPRKIAASQAAMVEMLGPTPEFIREAEIGDNASCYIFREAGGALVGVAWHHWDALDWTGFSEYRVADLFGTVLTGADLGEVQGPVYVLGGEADPAVFAEDIERALWQ
ncbi:MAG: hypothetical protein GF393_07440 [Armatimonadia bacterium]|nr:hypothetical protein [Armatimonadia bacterium]